VTGGQFIFEKTCLVQTVLVFKMVIIEGMIGNLRDPGCVAKKQVSRIFEEF